MKTIFFSLLLVLSSCLLNAQTFNVATYNLRNENTYDVGNMWNDRYPYVAKLIKYHNFDIFGTQEALPGQLEDLKQALPGYVYYGEGRDGNNRGEHAAIFYKDKKYNLLQKGDFWLSATPDMPSKSWDAPCCNRICSWIELEDKETGNKFFVFNAHYDYEKDYARDQSSLLILSKIKEIAGDNPVIFMGDLNGSANDSWCKLVNDSDILRDSYFDVDNPYANSSSFNAFGKANLDGLDSTIIREKQIIDHIYLSKHFETENWGLLTDTYDVGKFPSDHFPILIQVTFDVDAMAK